MASRGTCARISAIAAAAAIAFSTGVANAEPTAAERETARQLMEQGRDRLDAKDLTGALESFKAADDIMHVPTTGLQVASAQAALGHLVEARETLSRVIRIPKQAGEPAPFERARASANQLYDELGARIPTLRFDVRGATGDVAISVDDASVASAVVKVGFKVNPGHHVVVARSGGASARSEVDVKERETKDVVLQLTGGGPVAAGPAPSRPTEPARRGTSPLTWIGFGVAGVGVAVGSVTGLMMFSKKSDLEAGCTADKLCPPSTHDDYASAYTMATISTVSFVVAGVGAAVGVYGLLSSKPSRSTGAVKMEPWAGLGAGGLRGSF